MPASISAAMIVRDEADHLAECLESVGRLADQICIVDTGSSDDTPDIARHHGAVVASFPWSNDFSEARNRSLDLCEGDWVFVVDADERLAPADAAALRALAEGSRDRAYRFVTRNYTDDVNVGEFVPCPAGEPFSKGFRGWFPSGKVRLFPNGCGVRFEGAVHELVNRSLEQAGLAVADCAIPVHHYPLLRSADRVRRKRELYLELGLRKAAERPDDPKAKLELGVQYAELGRLGEAIRAYREALHLAPQDATILRNLGAVLQLAGRPDEAARALELSLRRDSASAEAWRNLGVVRGETGDWAGALACFEEALQRAPAWSDGHRYRSVALEHCGRLAEAVVAAQAALEAEPRSQACLQNYLGQMERLGRADEGRAFVARLGLPRG